MKNKSRVFHPFFFALFPVFYLYGYNKDLVHPSYMLWPLVFSLLLAVAIYLFCQHFLRTSKKSGLVSSLFLLTFFSFGHYLNLTPLVLGHPSINNLDYYALLIAWIVILVVATVLIKNSEKTFEKSTAYLNYVSIILLAMPIVTIVWYEITSKNVNELITNQNEITEITDATDRPDIYYLVLDGYGRTDVLEKYYQFNNKKFIDQLKDRGFFVANKGHTNYPQTYLSVASALNYQYVNELSQTMDQSSTDRGPLRDMIKNAKTISTLKQIGYKVVAFPYTWTGTYDNIEADVFMQNKINNSEFVDLFIQSTPLRIFSNTDIFLEGYRNKIRFAFEKLPVVADIDAPTFTYVHFLVPHPPFVFEKDGSNLKIEGQVQGDDGSHYFQNKPGVQDYKEKYIKQLEYTSKSILQSIDEILANSQTPPVIVLQSDHGPGSMLDWEDENKTNMHERMSILNAYHLPAKGKDMLYDSITPVNSFRVVFNALFDANLDLLEDRSYFARWSKPYDFIDVTDKLEE